MNSTSPLISFRAMVEALRCGKSTCRCMWPIEKGKKVKVHCPACNNKQVSLWLGRWKESRRGFYVRCTAGCTEDAVTTALGDRGLVHPASDLSILLYEIAAYLKRYVVFASSHQMTAVTLWVVHTYAIDAADTTPYLAISAPEKESGKTRLFKAIDALVLRPWRVVRPSDAVTYHKISQDKVTFLLDEANTIFGDHARSYHGLRAILDSGNERGTPVPRLVKGKVVNYDVFGPKALACIGSGSLPDTVVSRSIPIRMRRRLHSERIGRFRYRTADHRAAPFRERLERWAKASLSTLRDARPKIPELLNDRAQDGWEPLLAIADEAGGDWPRMAERAAQALHKKTRAKSVSDGVLLLQAVRDIFKEKNVKQISTKDLVEGLLARPDGVWVERWGDLLENGNIPKHNILKGGQRIARLLSDYQIVPKSIRNGKNTGKGYDRAQFLDAFKRYAR